MHGCNYSCIARTKALRSHSPINLSSKANGETCLSSQSPQFATNTASNALRN